jgi:hypothetical protein
LAAFNQPVLNDAGQVAFVGFEEGTLERRNGIFLTIDGVLTEVVRANDPAPDGNGSFVFFTSAADYTPLINNHGQLAFRADFNISRDADEGIVFRDKDGSLLLVAREGQVLEGSTITALDLHGSDWVGLKRDFGGRKALNERGQVVFRATLADGRDGIFLWTPSALRVGHPRLEGLEVVITVPSVTGSTYQLQSLDSLSSKQWQDVGSPVSGTDEVIELRHENGGSSEERFYRVLAL